MKKKLLGFYDYTVILTYCGMLTAFCGILCVMCQNYQGAILCLMIAGVCDMFDGAVANTRKRTDREKNFGIQIDSLSDLVSFGILPGVFVYAICGKSRLAGALASLFVLCGLIRLAYFNVLEEERQRRTAEKRKSYLGVPITTIAAALPIVYLLYDRHVCKRIVYFPILLTVMGIGYLLPVKIRKPGIVGKAALIILGMLETLALLLFMGWDAV